MTHTDWVPTREAELADLAQRWITGVSDAAKQNAFGWEAAECTAVAGLLNAYVTGEAAYAEDDSTAKRIARDNAKTAAVAAMRDFAAGSIRNNKKMHDEDKVYFGIHLPDKTPTRHPAPQSRPVFAGLKPLGGFRIEIHFHDEHTPDKRAILSGCNGCLLCYTWGPERIIDYTLLVKTVLMTRAPYTLALPPESEGKFLSCAARWQNDRGELGPWGDIEYVVIA